MRIVIDSILDSQSGNVIGWNVVHTEVAPWNKAFDPSVPATQIDMIQIILQYQTTPALMVAAGWSRLTTNPAYIGKTQLQVVQGEIVRLNDTAARAVLGI